MIRIFHRPAEASREPFAIVASLTDHASVDDELASWCGPRLRHGDLVRVFKGARERLFVFDAEASELVEVRSDPPSPPWVPFWEAPNFDAGEMIGSCASVALERVVLAACACVRSASRRAPDVEAVATDALAIAESWARHGRHAGVADRLRQVVAAAHRASLAAGEDQVAANAARAANSLARAVTAAAGGDAGRCVQRASAALWSSAASLSHEYGLSSASDRRANAEMADEVRRFVPLSVLACGRVGARDPLPLPKGGGGQ